MLTDFPLVESYDIHGSIAYIHGREENGQQFIAALGLESGTTKWKRSLPSGARGTGSAPSPPWWRHP